MTEQEWLTSEDPQAMLLSLEREWDKGGTYYAISDRKLRLFACACALTAFDDLSSPSRVDWERWVDSPRLDEMTAVEGAAYWCGRKVGQQLLKQLAMEQKRVRAALLRDIVGNPYRPVVLPPSPDRCSHPWLTPTVVSLAESAYEGNPCTISYPHLAHDWCDGRSTSRNGTLDHARLAILADALEEAGCDGRRCEACHGSGTYTVEVRNAALSAANGYGAATTYMEWRGCRKCGGDYDRKGTGRVPHPLLAHLRSPGPHVRGCWAIDLVLGKE